MSQELIHVYLMPGMAANPTIFEYIRLPETQFQIHLLEWMLPESKNETLEHYAERMTKLIKHRNVVLIGVSFGGVLVQEMDKFVKLKKLIIVSSISSPNELPKRLKFLRRTKLYNALPTQLASNIELLAKFAFGKTATKRLELYKKYLSINDKLYLDWAIKNLVCWEQKQKIKDLIQIHGDKDMVFPIKNISSALVIKDGTHIMIINKYKWFNENLPKLILDM